MSSLVYTLDFDDPAKTGLSLSFTIFSKTSDNLPVTPPAITELGVGFYKYAFDVEAVGSDVYYVATDGDANTLTGVLLLGNLSEANQKILRLLGLAQENQFIDNAAYDGNGNLTSARLRIYSNAVDVGTTNSVLATYTISATYLGSSLATYEMVKL